MEGTDPRGNMLIVGAKVVLPNETKFADVRTIGGVISEIAKPQVLVHNAALA